MTFNVNGLRAAMAKGFAEYIRYQDPDIVSLNEVKCEAHEVKLELKGYHVYWNASQAKKGYAGTAYVSSV